ncbi:MAG: hypothetical protein IIC97_06955, partial [Chloroflexi bacterium]|nr:hypothetical protein [Chloroflexota bacterium]
MADDAGRKEEEKFEFTPEGEALGYISLEQARVVAMQTARDQPGDYGSRYSGAQMVFEAVEQEEGDDYYVITLSFRPAGDFTGVPGQEQFFIEKEGAVAVRQMLSLPRPEGGRRLPIVPILVVLALIAAAGVGGALFFSGGLGGGGDSEVPAVLAPTASPVPTVTVVPPIIASTPTPVIVQREVQVVVTATPGPTSTPVPTPTPAPTQTPVIVQREVQVVVTATPGPTVVRRTATPPPPLAPTATPRPRPTKASVPLSTVGGIRGGHINMTAIYDLRPNWIHESVTLTFFTRPLFNGILQFDPNTPEVLDISCDLCTSWELASDGLTYTFHFPDGIQWHDGEPFVAA